MSSFPGSPRILKGGIVPLDMGITLSGWQGPVLVSGFDRARST